MLSKPDSVPSEMRNVGGRCGNDASQRGTRRPADARDVETCEVDFDYTGVAENVSANARCTDVVEAE